MEQDGMNSLPRIHPDRPQVFNGVEVSYGVAPILAKLSELSMRYPKPTWDLYLINIETLIRNHFKKDMTERLEILAETVLTDAKVLSQYIATFCRLSLPKNKKQQPLICFYIPKYENIPNTYLRDKFPKNVDIFWKIRDLILDKIQRDGYQESYDGSLVQFILVGEISSTKKEAWPHVELKNSISNILNGENLAYRDVLMVSHVPIDFQLYRVFKKFSIMESYTGNIKSVKDFGKKIFGNEDIPFNKYTHLLLGDKWYIKCQVTGKVKNQMKEYAKQQRWAIIPERSVLEQLVKCVPVNPDLYVRPNI